MTLPSIQQDSWREKANRQGQKRFARGLRRVVIVLAVAVLAGILLRLLFPPFFAPTTHLVLLGTGINEAQQLPPIPFVAEDYQQLAEIDSIAVHDQSQVWQTARRASRLEQELQRTGVGQSDTLLLYLTAHGVSQDGTAYLLCDNFDLRRPDSGRVSVDAVLEQISRSPAALKVLVINPGMLDYDPRLGMLFNEFPHLLEEAVKKTQDASLWVYCSHSTLQQAHVSRAAQRSVFGLFFTEGLKGAADLDHDRQIDLAELTTFANANVARWVQHASDRGALQTPKLFWGGSGEPPANSPVLLTLGNDAEQAEFDIAKFIDVAEEPGPSASLAGNVPQATGLLTRRHVSLNARPNSLPSTAKTAAQQAQAKSQQQATAPESSQSESPEARDTGTEQAQEAPPADQPVKDPPSAPDPSLLVSQLLADAWQVRDDSANLWSATDRVVSPIENVPHLWREFEAELLGFEQGLRAGSAFDATAVLPILQANFSKQLPPTADNPAAATNIFEATHDSSAAGMQFTLDQPHSFALAQLTSELTSQSINQPTKVLDIDLEGLHDSLEQDARKGLDEWLTKNWRRELADYYEFRFLKRLADPTGSSEIEWDVLRTAANTCLLGERVAALDWIAPGWVRRDVDRADRLRFFGEELVFDQIGPQWQTRVTEIFDEATAIYKSAESVFDEIRMAERLRDELFDKTPYYLQRYRSLRGMPGNARLRYDVLETLLTRLADLTGLLNDPEATSSDELIAVRLELEKLHSRVESVVGDSAVLPLVDNTQMPGEAWQAELFLETPLVSASVRRQLLSAVYSLDRESALSFQPTMVTGPEPGRSLTGSSCTLAAQDWQFLLELARLETMFVNLCQIAGSNRNDALTTSPNLDASLSANQAVAEALKRLEAKHQAAMTALGQSQNTLSSENATDSLWNAYAAFGATLATFYSDINVLPSGSSACRDTSWQTAGRLLRMLDARDAWRFRQVDSSSLSAAARLQSTLEWQAARLEEASIYLRRFDARSLANAAESYRHQCSSICGQHVDTTPRSPLVVSLPPFVDLQYTSSSEFSIELINQGLHELSFGLALDYDRDLVSLTSVNDLDGGDRQAPMRRAEGRNASGPSSYSLNLATQPRPLSPGQSLRMQFRIARQGRASQRTKIIVDVYQAESRSNEAERETGNECARLLARQKIDVELPVAEVLAHAASGTSVSTGGKLTVNPFPNRMGSIKFGVVNQSSIEKQLRLSLYNLQQPFSQASVAEYSQLVESQKPLAEYNLTAPGDGRPAFPALAEEPMESKEAEASPEASGPTQAAKPAPAADAPPADAPPVVVADLPHGLLAVVHDMEAGQTTYREIEFVVQRPRRFVRPLVKFNATTNRIEIDIAAIDPSLLPSGGPVRINCRLAEAAPGSGRARRSLQGKLQATIQAPDYAAKLFINMPSTPPEVVRLYLDVDDYPRAFIFDVACGRHEANVPEVTELMDVRIATSSQQGFRPATNSIPIAVEIDAPVGTFESNNDFVEFSLDLEGTGDLDPASTVRLNADRSAAIGFIKALPDGTLQFQSTVSDFELALPSQSLENVQVDVATRIRLRNEMRSNPNVPLFIDTAPPIVGSVKPTNYVGFVPAQTPLELSIWVWDAASGVERVEAVFDTLDSGEFPAEGSFTQASLRNDRQWDLVIDSGALTGTRTLLVRGVDYVGNQSEPVRVPLEIVSPSESIEKTQLLTVELAGTVIFRDDLVPQAEIKLTSIPATPDGTASEDAAAIVKTRPDGGYSISGVAPGSYLLNAKGVINNRVRRTQQEITVAPGPQRTIQVDLVLP